MHKNHNRNFFWVQFYWETTNIKGNQIGSSQKVVELLLENFLDLGFIESSRMTQRDRQLVVDSFGWTQYLRAMRPASFRQQLW